MKKRVLSFDLIRCLAIFCIVIFHLMLNDSHIYPESIFFHNYDMAQVGVSLFFILSGAALYYNDTEKFSVLKYYKKRFLAIFPMFYVAYVATFLYYFWVRGSINPDIPFKNMIFSVFAMDGLFGYKVPCLNMTGEWFLGCIVFIYLAYPVIRWAMKKKPVITMVAALAVYIVFYYNYNFELSLLYNPVIRGLEFVFGMFYIEMIERKDKVFDNISWIKLVIALTVTLIIWYAPVSIPQMWMISFGGMALFVASYEVGKLIRTPKLTNIIKTGSKYSYAVFLVHHNVAFAVQNHFAELGGLHRKFEFVCAILCYFILVGFFAKLLHMATKRIMSLFKRQKVQVNS